MEVCPIETLGERIRKLRKQQKLTLEALAGKELTKGMLSLIENNKANPSMESLSYIASRLGVETSELLEEVSSQELRGILEQAEKLYNVEFDDLSDEFEQLIALISPYSSNLTQGYEAARLLEIYSVSLYYEKQEDWQVYSDKSALMYEQMNITRRRASIGIFRAIVKFNEHNYQRAIDILLSERAEIEAQSIYIDSMTRLDFDHTEAVLHFAAGNSADALRVMESGIAFSREKQVFYQIDHLYRLAAFHAMMTGKEENIKYYIRKIELYGEFTDDIHSILFTKFIKVHSLNSYEKNYEKALELLERYQTEYQLGKVHETFFHLEKGKALFGLNHHQNALDEFKKIEIARYLNHPFDLAILYESDAYIALSYLALGNHQNALEHAKLAYDNISPMPHSPYKDFIHKTYKKILCEQ